MSESNGCEEWKPFMAMIVVDFVFAVLNILMKKVLEQGMDHLVIVTYRLSISAVFVAPIAFFLERNNRPKLTLRVSCCLFISALVGACLTQYLFLLGIEYTTPTFAAAFVNMVPVLTFLMALPFGAESVELRCTGGKAKVVGTLVCIGGGAILTLYRGPSLFGSSHHVESALIMLSPAKRAERWMVGTIALVVGTLSLSSWFILQSSIGKWYPCQYSSTAIMSFFGALQSAVLTFFVANRSSVWILHGWLQVFTVLFAGIVGSGLGYVAMSWCVKKRGPVFTAAFSPLVQIMAAFIDIPVLHGHFYLGSLLGSIVVIIGLYILLWGKKKETQELVSKVALESNENKARDSRLQIITISGESRRHEI